MYQVWNLKLITYKPLDRTLIVIYKKSLKNISYIYILGNCTITFIQVMFTI